MRSLLAALGLLLAACSSEAPAVPPGGEALPPAEGLWLERGEAAPPAAPLAWLDLGPLNFSKEGGASLATPSPPGCRRRLLRLIDPPSGPLRAFAADGPGWSADGGPGYGLFLLPEGLSSLSISLVDPLVGGPSLDASASRVQARAGLGCSPAAPAGASLTLDLRVAIPRGLIDGPLLSSPWWIEAEQEARGHLARAGIRLVVTAVAHLPDEAPEELRLTPGVLEPQGAVGPGALAALGEREAPFVPLVLARRMRWLDPTGQLDAELAAYSTRIVGGYSPGPFSAVLLALEDQQGPATSQARGRRAGAALAHELGHYLGLRHDALHDAQPAPSTLMDARAAHLEPGQVTFSDEQAAAMRLHPLLTYPEASP